MAFDPAGSVKRDVTASIVSHGHGAMVWRLVDSLLQLPEIQQIIVTLNIDEPLPQSLPPHVQLIHNTRAKGFGANHNAAHQHCTSTFFWVLNPDIELPDNPLPMLLRHLTIHCAGVIAPLALDATDRREDNFRKFPTTLEIAGKLFGRTSATLRSDNECFASDWVAGMCMLFAATAYREVQGFDENYFLYYEDVDICLRLWRSGWLVLACPAVAIRHLAQRDSHRRVRYLLLHMRSFLRYLVQYAWRQPKVPR